MDSTDEFSFSTGYEPNSWFLWLHFSNRPRPHGENELEFFKKKKLPKIHEVAAESWSVVGGEMLNFGENEFVNFSELYMSST